MLECRVHAKINIKKKQTNKSTKQVQCVQFKKIEITLTTSSIVGLQPIINGRDLNS